MVSTMIAMARSMKITRVVVALATQVKRASVPQGHNDAKTARWLVCARSTQALKSAMVLTTTATAKSTKAALAKTATNKPVIQEVPKHAPKANAKTANRSASTDSGANACNRPFPKPKYATAKTTIATEKSTTTSKKAANHSADSAKRSAKTANSNPATHALQAPKNAATTSTTIATAPPTKAVSVPPVPPAIATQALQAPKASALAPKANRPVAPMASGKAAQGKLPPKSSNATAKMTIATGVSTTT